MGPWSKAKAEVEALLGRLGLGSQPSQPKEKLALAEGQPDVAEGAAAVDAGDWAKLERLYAKRAPADRYHFLRGVADLCKLQGPRYAGLEQVDPIIAAGLRVGWAWRHRGYGVAQTVTDRGADAMITLLIEAAKDLQRAPNLDSVACALRIRIEMGLRGEREILDRLLEIAETDQPNIFVPLNHLAFVAPKWHGSAVEIIEVALDYAARSDHPAWKALPAVAHAENWLYRCEMQTDEAERAAAKAYFEGPEFAALVKALDEDFWRARLAYRGRLHHAEMVIAHNYLAYLCYRCRMPSRMGPHLAATQDVLTLVPWGYLGVSPENPKVIAILKAVATQPDPKR